MSAFYQHKSGAQKRHEKEQRDKEAQKGSRTLFHVGVIKASSSLSSDWRPTIPQVMETICEKSQGGNDIDGIKEQGEAERERGRGRGSSAQGHELSQNIERSLKFQCANFDIGQESEIVKFQSRQK